MRIFADMDGTMARFYADPNFLTRMFEPGYFAGLKPYENVVSAVELLIANGKDLYVLSSIHDECRQQTVWEKESWLDSYLYIPGHRFSRLFPPVGISKATYVASVTGRQLSKDDVLLDDFNKNLFEWERNGGSGIKLLNEINGRGLHGPVWHGPCVSYEAPPDEIATAIIGAVNKHGRIDSTDKTMNAIRHGGKTMNRFNVDGSCRCDHVKSGHCSQCSACPDCKYYTHEEGFGFPRQTNEEVAGVPYSLIQRVENSATARPQMLLLLM